MSVKQNKSQKYLYTVCDIICFKMTRCAYCTTHYTVIAKAETFKEDLRCPFIIVIILLLILIIIITIKHNNILQSPKRPLCHQYSHPVTIIFFIIIILTTTNDHYNVIRNLKSHCRYISHLANVTFEEEVR